MGCHWHLASADVGTDVFGEICQQIESPFTHLTGQSPVAHFIAADAWLLLRP